MSMKVTRLYTYWTAEEAYTVIEFMDVLREQLYETYGDAITDMLRDASANPARHKEQIEFAFDDDIEF